MQDQGCGFAIDATPVGVTLGGARRTAGPAPRGATDSAFSSFARQPFVAVAEGQTSGHGHGLGPLARPRRLKTLPAVHVERQSYDQCDRALLGGQARYYDRVRGDGLGARYCGEGRGNSSCRIAQGDADSPLAEVNAQATLRISGGRIPGRSHGDGGAVAGAAAAESAGETEGDAAGDGDFEAAGGDPAGGRPVGVTS